MAKELFLDKPSEGFLKTVEGYQEERRKAGRDRLFKSGLQIAGVGLVGAGLILACAWVLTVKAPLGLAVAAGAVGVGAVMAINGATGKIRGRFKRNK